MSWEIQSYIEQVNRHIHSLHEPHNIYDKEVFLNDNDPGHKKIVYLINLCELTKINRRKEI